MGEKVEKPQDDAEGQALRHSVSAEGTEEDSEGHRPWRDGVSAKGEEAA
jgi:hypothetical protein